LHRFISEIVAALRLTRRGILLFTRFQLPSFRDNADFTFASDRVGGAAAQSECERGGSKYQLAGCEIVGLDVLN